ncbi:ankyrin repeat-containing domain protein [Trichophaea hybrida]|nr:ankyrin repeat-containing domain protein [Trichophaea hybrida]
MFGVFAVPSVPEKSRTAHRPRPSDGTVDITDIVAVARKLIEYGANINEEGPDEATASTLASSGDRIEIVKLLLGKGAKITIPLYNAAKTGSLRAIECLLDNGADVDAIHGKDNQATPLALAIKHGRPRVVKVLLDWGARVLNVDDALSAFQLSCTHGSLEIVQLLLDLWAEKRLDIGMSDPFGWRALDFAASFGHIEVVRLLLEHGASIRYYDSPVIWYLIETESNIALANGSLDILNLLLQEVENLEQLGEILHYAQESVVAALSPALSVAVEMGYDRTLLDTDIEVNMVSEYGESALPWAESAQGSRRAVRLLLDAGADVSRETKYGWTPRTIVLNSNCDSTAITLPPIGREWLPACISQTDAFGVLKVSDDDLSLSYVNTEDHSRPLAGSARSRQPIPVGANLFYYEMTIIETNTRVVGLGFCTALAILEERMPGWQQDTNCS